IPVRFNLESQVLKELCPNFHFRPLLDWCPHSMNKNSNSSCISLCFCRSNNNAFLVGVTDNFTIPNDSVFVTHSSPHCCLFLTTYVGRNSFSKLTNPITGREETVTGNARPL